MHNIQHLFTFFLCIPIRSTNYLCITVILVKLIYAGPAYAEGSDNASDAVMSLHAYAQFKSGNHDKARLIWEKLASKGNTTALINLANLFQQGMGVNKDHRQALDYVRRAAKLGDARAQYELGIEYEKGFLVNRNIQLAAIWLQRSALQDNVDGQYAYGILLATAYGKGLSQTTDKQRKQALKWLKKSRANGHPDAAKYIQLLINPENLESALKK